MRTEDLPLEQPTLGAHAFEEYLEMVRAFHGNLAPGMILGGFMVDLAIRRRTEGEFFDVLCETRSCLPDAVQLLTPCTIGNGWLKIINMGRFALTMYEKYGGQGVRVFVDASRLEPWPRIRSWYFKLHEKKDQDLEALLDEMRRAGAGVCGVCGVQLDPEFIRIRRRQGFALCPVCKEAYPVQDGSICLGCQGEAPYLETAGREGADRGKTLRLRTVPVEQAAGLHALHDMTRIVPGKEKGPAFKHAQRLDAGDICHLQKMGRQHVYVAEFNPEDPRWVHEDEAALAFARAMAGEGVTFTQAPSEGKAELLAARDGILVVDIRRLEAFNLLPSVKCASRHGFLPVKKAEKLAGTRALPLYLSREDFEKALAVCEGGPLFEVRTVPEARVGILVTGTEVFLGMVEERFIPVIRSKVEAYGCKVADALIVPDDRNTIRDSVKRLLDLGADLLVTTAGLSVDPDDVTRQGLLDAGAQDVIYGAPVLPGNMTLLARIGRVPIIGVPACALYHGTTSFDLLLPRILAGVEITRRDLATLGHGGMCLGCKPCTFPRCPFGK